MNKFLNYRIVFITILFAAFGGILSSIMDIESIGKWSYAAIASLIALVTSLFISFLLKGNWKKMHKSVQWISTLLFILFLISCFVFIWLFRFQLTFEMKEFDNSKTPADTSGIAATKMVRYIKGTHYTTNALNYIKDNPGAEKNPEELVNSFGGSRYIESVWDPESRNHAQFYLMLCYCVFVLLFVANVSLLCEVLVTKYKNKTPKARFVHQV
jgi:heme/copper-type cytochrome/quinol oxidase subunit 2